MTSRQTQLHELHNQAETFRQTTSLTLFEDIASQVIRMDDVRPHVNLGKLSQAQQAHEIILSQLFETLREDMTATRTTTSTCSASTAPRYRSLLIEAKSN